MPLQSSSAAGDPLNLELAASWQLNRAVLAKARVDRHGASLSLAGKSWWQPAVTVAVAGHAPYGGLLTWAKKGRIGLEVHVENVTGPGVYERASPSTGLSSAPTYEYVAEDRELDGTSAIDFPSVRARVDRHGEPQAAATQQ